MPFVRVGISYSLRSQHDANIRIGTNDANEYESSTFVRHGLYLHPATGGMLACSLYGVPEIAKTIFRGSLGITISPCRD